MRRNRIAVGGLVAVLAVGFAAGAPYVGAAPATTVTPKMQAPPEARSLSNAFSRVAKAVGPSVVRLDVEIEQPRMVRNERGERGGPPGMEEFLERFFGEGAPFPSPGPGQGTGSGFILDSAGHILTNNHVVAKAKKVTVVFSDGRELSATVRGTDDLTDVAVVKLDKPPAQIVTARLGDSDKVEVGEWSLAVGSPLGMDQTVTAGIISSKGKLGRNSSVRMSGEKVREYIQTDAKINPGNSGGPLLNLEGEVIGVNTLINTGPGGAYGFAIPINQARRVAEALIKEGRMRYAYLGVVVGNLRDIDADTKNRLPKNAPSDGAFVSKVTPGGPAAKAGLRPGDIITRIDKRQVQGSRDVVDYVSGQAIGSKVSLAYLRDGKPRSLEVKLGEYPTEGGTVVAVADQPIGIQMQDLTPDIARFLRLPEDTQGAVITEVLPGSRAAKAGLQSEDVILEVDRQPVDSANQAVQRLKDKPAGIHYLKIRRGAQTRLLTIPPG